MSAADDHIEALRASIGRLHDLVIGMSEAELTRPAYPTEWTIADVVSHLGSGAVITRRRLNDTVAGVDTPEGFAQGVWDSWNAKEPVAQRDDALAADAELLARIDAITPEQRETFASTMGPMTLDFQAFVGMRLNEHALHTWDIEVVRDPTATVAQPAAQVIVDNLELITRFTAKPTGDTQAITVVTTDPPRTFVIELTPDAVRLDRSDSPAGVADVEFAAEAFIRLVYGRLDADRDGGTQAGTMQTLRGVFPGP